MGASSCYTELHCHSYFSLLDGASSPEALVARAKELGMSALALTDHDSLAGAIRFWTAARRAELHPVIGGEVTMEDGGHLTLLAENQQGYANLCRLLTAGHLGPSSAQTGLTESGQVGSEPTGETWPGKGEPALSWDLLHRHREGLLVLSGCRQGPVAAPLLRDESKQARNAAGHLVEIFGPAQVWIELQHHCQPEDDRLMRQLLTLARSLNLPAVLTNNVHYAEQAGSRLRDALIAIRHNQSLTQARQEGRLPSNSNYYLASPAEMAHRFAEIPQALAQSREIAQRCRVSLDFSGKRLPAFPTPGDLSEFEFLYQLCHDNLPQRYPRLTSRVLKQLAHELDVIEKAGLAGYFLTVWDIVRFAREQGIRCQGRGSAAGSIVAYLLHISSIDPLRHNLLFERFLSEDRYTTPDIDIDFAADRREEVIQYVYRRYGHAHAAMVCNVVTYRARSAVRDLGKVLGFPPPVIDRLAKSLDTHSPARAAERIEAQLEERFHGQETGEDEPQERGTPVPATHALPSTHPLLLLAHLLRQIDGCPRHLSIHNGGMLISGPPLDEVTPLERATMPGRFVCQWDKDSVEDAGLIKIDLLGLRTLGLVAEALAHIAETGADVPDLDHLPLDDPAVYQMLQRGDTIGAFQVESRAQQQMLSRLKPACFEDIAVEVAIVRPGPIQGGAVHPYLRRRSGLEPVTYLHPCLEPVLEETLGVLLFQEQAIQVAVAAANFSPGEADMLRRALSRSRSEEAMATMQRRFFQGTREKGIDDETARAIFDQLAGFAGYGFCKSHAASFALIAYQTLYLKLYHAPGFYCALLNQQPMGFYSPEVILGDARRHGVELLPPDIQCSHWRYTLEQTSSDRWAVRVGLRTVAGLGEEGWKRIEGARRDGLFTGLEDFCQRTRLPRDVVSNLIRAGVLASLGERRRLLWALGEVRYTMDDLGLSAPIQAVDLPELDALEQTIWEYELLGLSPAGQVMAHYRERLRRAGIMSTWQVKQARAGRRVQVAGMAVVRQRPSTANGIMFISLEDESGLLDLVVKPDIYQRYRPILRREALLLVEGTVQRSGRAVSLLVGRAESLRR